MNLFHFIECIARCSTINASKIKLLKQPPKLEKWLWCFRVQARQCHLPSTSFQWNPVYCESSIWIRSKQAIQGNHCADTNHVSVNHVAIVCRALFIVGEDFGSSKSGGHCKVIKLTMPTCTGSLSDIPARNFASNSSLALILKSRVPVELNESRSDGRWLSLSCIEI